jgi:hypothetical protein
MEIDMEMKPVVSSNIAKYGYDESTQTLRIEFRNGGVYDYSGVPSEIVADLADAPSIGSYFHNNIRNQFTAVKQ